MCPINTLPQIKIRIDNNFYILIVTPVITFFPTKFKKASFQENRTSVSTCEHLIWSKYAKEISSWK